MRAFLDWFGRHTGWAIVLSLVAAVTISIVVGFIGAPAGSTFDWRLMAEAGTAFGTLALAAYTAWLATTTRGEVGLAIEEQRARDRPIVVVSVGEIGALVVERDISKTIPTLGVTLRNVGLAPALDVHVRASYGTALSNDEVIPVLPVDVPYEALISLTAIPLPGGGFRPEELTITGDFTDRQQRVERSTIVVLNISGTRDEEREGGERVAGRAWPWFALLTPTPVRNETGTSQSFRCNVGNRGPADARDVVAHVVDSDGSGYVEPHEVGHVRRDIPSDEFAITLPVPHPDLRSRLTWNDGDGQREQLDQNITFPAVS
jgi:hypothetical protein